MHSSSIDCPGCGANLKAQNGPVTCEFCGRTTVIEGIDQAINTPSGLKKFTPHQTIVQEAKPVFGQYHDQKSGNIAMILWFFFGILGVHRFYVGKKISGIVYLLTIGGLGFGWFVDFFLFYFGRFSDAQKCPLTPVNTILKKIIGGFLCFWVSMTIFAALIPDDLPEYTVLIALGLAIFVVNAGFIWRLINQRNERDENKGF